MKTFDDYVLDFLSSYDADSLHVAPAISQKRMQSATKAHGVDPRDRVWAIIDATLLGHTSKGSADNGMSITASGIYWKNSWLVRSRLTHYSWADLVDVADTMEVASGNVRFAPGVEFYAPTDFKAAHIINMLQAMARLYLDHQQAATDQAVSAPGPVPLAAETPLLEGGASGYARAAGTCLGILTCHAGPVDDACAALAIELLTEEEAENPGALAAFEETIEQLAAEAGRSATFFKLRQAKLLATVTRLPVANAERLVILCEAVGGTGGATELAERIKRSAL